MYKKIVEGIVAHVIAGVLVSGVSTMAAEMPKSISNIGNNELKVGYISDIQYSENPDSMYFDECTDIITFNIDGQLYAIRDFAEDMFVNDWCLIIVNNKGTENVEDDVILDWRAYWDCDRENYYYEPGVIGGRVIGGRVIENWHLPKRVSKPKEY